MDLFGIISSLVIIGIAAWIIAKACDGFEVAADYLGHRLSDGVKGATINAIGSSLPELLITAVFLFFFHDKSGLAGGIGTTAGSAVFNIMIIPALSIFAALKIFKISFVKVSKKVILRDGLALIAISILFTFVLRETLDWWHGLILISFYALYSAYMIFSMNGNKEARLIHEPHPYKGSKIKAFLKLDLESALLGGKILNRSRSWGLLLASTAVMVVACYTLVYGCEHFGIAIGVHGYFVAVILAAAASSVPDTILSIKDAKKGNYDDAVSNALGSNIFDISFALGFPIFLYTILYGSISIPAGTLENITDLRIILLIITIFAVALFYFGKGIGKIKSFLLLLIYFLFVLFIIGKAYGLI
jgi:cation:H+ antiporter